MLPAVLALEPSSFEVSFQISSSVISWKQNESVTSKTFLIFKILWWSWNFFLCILQTSWRIIKIFNEYLVLSLNLLLYWQNNYSSWWLKLSCQKLQPLSLLASVYSGLNLYCWKRLDCFQKFLSSPKSIESSLSWCYEEGFRSSFVFCGCSNLLLLLFIQNIF